MAEPLYVIRRASAEPSDPGDVYVAGPLFGSPRETGIYSSTSKADEASRFTANEANDLIARGKWRHRSPRVIPAEDAHDLDGGQS